MLFFLKGISNMVKIVRNKGKLYYSCEECNFTYKDNETAKMCEKWCKKYKSCNLEIIKDAVKLSILPL